MTPLIAGVGGGFLAIIIMIIGIFYFVRKINKKNNLANTPVNSRPTSQQDPAERNSVTLLRSFFVYVFLAMSGYSQVPHPTKKAYSVLGLLALLKEKLRRKELWNILPLYYICLRIEPIVYGLHNRFNYQGKRGAKWRLGIS